MKNFQVTSKEDGKQYWISRSCAVLAVIFVINSNREVFVLANKRGPGAADFHGFWNCPCGYIDFDETGTEAAAREVFEETGYKINHKFLRLYGVQTDPKENRQNITIRYFSIIRHKDLLKSQPVGGEDQEVSEVKLIPINNIRLYKWAFNHDKIISEIYGSYI